MKDSKIIDVARRANVSVATVSRVLNASHLVSPKTKEKVLKAIEEMNYTPNALAKNLRSRKTMTLGVVVSDILVAYYAEIIKGIENTANSLQYKILICDAQNQKEKEQEYMSLLMNRTVDGMILVTPKLSNKEIAAYADNGYTIGLIGRFIDHPNIPCAYTDNVKMAKEVVNHLIGQGHEKIAFLSGYADAIDSYERLEGYMKALRDAGMPFIPDLIENGNFNEEGGYAAFKRLKEKNIDFTAVFAANDEMALGVYKACRELSIEIPRQMAVVGVDNNRITKYVTPKMSTVEQPKYTMGALLAEKLIDQMNDNAFSDKRAFKVDSKLLIRESSLSS
ncbi:MULTISPECIES: LacI family DNA-binding transcriptional regulator [Cohnella]|jgi:LacI family transcriptional regulator|uniref:LacI family DNA-binding transcriptional regulator n=1 Tax=Cohnella TaxID=329857 RepID=UPI0003800374|nr:MULTISPECIES: LacI family DNA-binding transcriptional regulator [Cohnella]REK65038.1 MAG: LacI family transcriptional regulator [Cohnella sp.]